MVNPGPLVSLPPSLVHQIGLIKPHESPLTDTSMITPVIRKTNRGDTLGPPSIEN